MHKSLRFVHFYVELSAGFKHPQSRPYREKRLSHLQRRNVSIFFCKCSFALKRFKPLGRVYSLLLKELVFFPKFTEYKGGNIHITLMSNIKK